jgi:hypothetical protein
MDKFFYHKYYNPQSPIVKGQIITNMGPFDIVEIHRHGKTYPLVAHRINDKGRMVFFARQGVATMKFTTGGVMVVFEKYKTNKKQTVNVKLGKIWLSKARDVSKCESVVIKAFAALIPQEEKRTALLEHFNRRLTLLPPFPEDINNEDDIVWWFIFVINAIILAPYDPHNSKKGDAYQVESLFDFSGCNCTCGTAVVVAFLECIGQFPSNYFKIESVPEHIYLVAEFPNSGKTYVIETTTRLSDGGNCLKTVLPYERMVGSNPIRISSIWEMVATILVWGVESEDMLSDSDAMERVYFMSKTVLLHHEDELSIDSQIDLMNGLTGQGFVNKKDGIWEDYLDALVKKVKEDVDSLIPYYIESVSILITVLNDMDRYQKRIDSVYELRRVFIETWGAKLSLFKTVDSSQYVRMVNMKREYKRTVDIISRYLDNMPLEDDSDSDSDMDTDEESD